MLKTTRRSSRRINLPAPRLPQALNGVIDVSKLTGDIIVRVDKYIGMKAEDRIVAYFGTIRSEPATVKVPGTIDLKFNRFLPNGIYEVYYTAEDLFANTSVSDPTRIEIIKSSEDVYPAPIFPDAAADGKIYYRSIAARGGTRIRAHYSAIKFGDTVTFYWSGTDANGNSIPSADFTSPPIPVLDASIPYVETLIPQQYILALGDDGVGTGYYVVDSVDRKRNTSAPSSVTISWDDRYDFAVNVTTEAPIVDTRAFPYLKPYNRVSVIGEPGLVVKAAATAGAMIDDGLAAASVPLDENGIGEFKVSSKKVGLVIVNVYTLEPDLNSKTPSMTFQGYTVGLAGIHAYGTTTGAPNDGMTPCSIYLQADEGVTSIEARVNGSALINGWTQNGTFPVHTDGTATLNVVNDVAETITLYMRATGNGNSPMPINFAFSNFPDFTA